MGIFVKLDRKQLTDPEKNELFQKVKTMAIPMMTPETWKRATGKSEDDLAVFIKQFCRIHNIRHFLSGQEQLGLGPKMIIIDAPVGKCFFLVSLRPDYPQAAGAGGQGEKVNQ